MCKNSEKMNWLQLSTVQQQKVSNQFRKETPSFPTLKSNPEFWKDTFFGNKIEFFRENSQGEMEIFIEEDSEWVVIPS